MRMMATQYTGSWVFYSRTNTLQTLVKLPFLPRTYIRDAYDEGIIGFRRENQRRELGSFKRDHLTVQGKRLVSTH